LNNDSGIAGLKTDEIKGTERIVGHLETILFTPFNRWGFRFSGFAGFDFGMIGNGSDLLSSNTYYSLTSGMRIKNDFLVFGTYQFSFTWLPVVPLGIDKIQFSALNLPRLSFFNYAIGGPSYIPFN